MKIKFLVVIFASLLLHISCSRSDVKRVDKKVYNVSFERCKEVIDLKLSDLIDMCRLIPLETKNECVLSQNPKIMTTATYIIILDRNGLLKFSADGKFIKKLLSTGRGPSDLPLSFTYLVIEKNNQILINNRYDREKLLVYDYEAEKFLDPVKKAVPGNWGAFSLYKDSLILASLNAVLTDTTAYELFLQNFKGQLVSSITKGKKMFNSSKKEVVQRLVICNASTENYVYYTYEDTLFKYNNNQLSPYVIVSYNSSRTFERGVIAQEGESRVNFTSMDNEKFMLLSELIFLGMTPNEMGGSSANYTQNYFFLNKTNGSFSRINSYTDNITGKVQKGTGSWPLRESIIPNAMQNNNLTVLYDASILKTIKPGNKLLDNMPAGTNEMLQKILKSIDEMDNPVLLIGTIK
jgi:hypothetical protein